MRRVVSLIAFIAFGLCGTQPLFAQGEHAAANQAAPAQAAPVAQPAPAHHEHSLAATHEHAAGNAVTPSEEHSGHAAEAHGEHAGAHEEEDVSFSDINWAYGLLGESDDPEPSLLFRPKGMPAPFLATFINWLVLVSLIVAFAKKQLPAALKKRKASLVQGMEEAARVKAQAEAHLAELETKLGHVDQEIEQIKSDMQRQSEIEREKILREAEERRARMERDAARLIMTELEAAKEQLRREVVTAALQQATDQVSRQLTSGDQERLFQEALGSLKGLPNKSLGGRA
jgi:F-type H+-transporting ATPase subunit b